MSDRRDRCPHCGSHDTERAHTEWTTFGVQEVRICNDCPVQYTNEFSRLIKETDNPDAVAGESA